MIGAFFGPGGQLIGVVGGGVIGGIAGSEVVDYFMPDGDEDLPSEARKAPIPEDLNRQRWETHRDLPYSPYKATPGQ